MFLTMSLTIGDLLPRVPIQDLRPNMFPFSICDVEKVEMVSIVLELDCPVNTEPRSQVIIKSTVEKADRDVAHIRIGEHSRKINRPPRNVDKYQALLGDSATAEHALDSGYNRFAKC
ncbi:hypothetical protein T265_09422 [Opisthorchis viverrini]|uniref:Uncharacterized protein n=1 Tax=Opisthorchis viverrini TaxID=6198 RepID=A0A074ZA79_OPIVI|nr:hypothetical protein T265_09422 [Opisthorchis viverrini]KER22497.1 hypothetical protein T265_09422 [Opisthorchis viverrini]